MVARLSTRTCCHSTTSCRRRTATETGVRIPANALALDGGTIKHAGDGTTEADLAHEAAPADPTRKVDGSRTAP